MKIAKLPNILTLENLIAKNIIRPETESIPAALPTITDLNILPNKQQETTEAMLFIQSKIAEADKNRFKHQELENNTTFNNANDTVNSFLKKAQTMFDARVAKILTEAELKEALEKDADKLVHSSDIKAVMKAMEKAIKPVIERLDEIDGGFFLENHSADDFTTSIVVKFVKYHYKHQ